MNFIKVISSSVGFTFIPTVYGTNKLMLLYIAQSVKNIFAINHPEEFYNKHVLLVDDIITTGATLQACIDVLRPIRKCHYSVFGIGKTR